MTKLELQIRELSPSVKDALFRRLLFAEDLAWLRDEKKKNTVIGFEVELDKQELSGFALIAIQRHTVIAFVSDRDENPRLILFPALETLFDPGFELLGLVVTRKEFTDATFNGITTGHGTFGDMVKDLTPPNRKVDISETALEQMSQNIIKNEKGDSIKPEYVTHKPDTTESCTTVSQPEPATVEDDGYNPEYEEGPPAGFDEDDNDFDNYTEPEYGYDEYDTTDSDTIDEQESEPEMSRSDKLKAQISHFGTLNDVIDFVVTKLGINRQLAVTLANKAMQSKVSPEYRIQLAVKIFCKLIDEDKI